MKTIILVSAILLGSSRCASAADTGRSESPPTDDGMILLEAEAFRILGGWVVDPQFMDTMGSPYLLAHGLGQPVADASTDFEVKTAGNYRVWVRTKDWVAQWKAPGTPGRFQVAVNGRALNTVFGTEGAQWHWQDGGSVDLPKGPAQLALHDLTGFEGRCDAILLVRDSQFTPPNQDPAMSVFRRAAFSDFQSSLNRRTTLISW